MTGSGEPSLPRWVVRATIALALLTIVAYAPALRAPFLFDDLTSIADNASIRQLWPPSVPLEAPNQSVVAGRPIVNYTLAVNYAINEVLGVDQRPDSSDPDATFSYHVANLLMHLACGALLFGIIRRTLRYGRAREADGDRDPWPALAGLDSDGVAMAVAALWLLHPIQTEAVDYVVQRTELLMSACYLGTLYASIRAWDAPDARARMPWYAIAVVVCLLGMGSKEVMITAPLAVVLYDRAFRVTSWRLLVRNIDGRTWFYGLLGATMAWSIALIVGGPRNQTVGFHLGVTWDAYLYSQAWAILHYIQLVFWPDRLNLDYGQNPITGLRGIPGVVVVTGFLVATVVAWTRVEKWGWFGFLGAWFFMILAPSSSFVPISTEIAAERRIYLALASVLVLVVVGGARLVRYLAADVRMRDLRWVVGGVSVVLAGVTFERSRLYANSEAMWRDVTVKAPRNPRGYDNLAILLIHQNPPRIGEAAALYQQAIAVDSVYLPALYKLAVLDIVQGQPANGEPLLDRVLAIDSNNVNAKTALGTVLVETGQPARAIPFLERLSSESPNAQSLSDLGTAYMETGRTDDAIKAFRAALHLIPSRTDVARNLGAALMDQGRSMLSTNRAAQAEDYLTDAVQLSPSDPEAITALGEAKAALGKRADAIELFKRALNVQPDYAPARQALDRISR